MKKGGKMRCKVKVKVITYATSVFVQLEGSEIGLAYDGDKLYRATKEIIIADCVLDLVFQCNGFNGTDWEISVILNDAQKPLFKKKGSILKKNFSLIRESIKIPGCK